MPDATITRESDRTEVRLGADLVAAYIPQLRSTLRSEVSEHPRQLVLDLTAVRMLDSSGIGLLIATHNSMKKAGGKLSVVHASEDILDLLKIMRIHQHFDVSGA